MKKRPILVTGAAGFLGRHLLEALVKEHPEVKPLALLREEASWKKMDWTQSLRSVETITGSVTELEPWWEDPRLDNLGGIFHLAAVIRHSRQNSEEVYRTNVEGLLNMVRLAAVHHCRLVFVSTSGTVGCFRRPDQWADEESPYCEEEVSDWPYYDSKIQAERRARQLAGQLGVDLVIIRPPVLLGPGDHRFRATGHILRLLRGKIPFLLKGGIHFVDVRDASRAILCAMFLNQPRPIYHLNGTACTLDEFFKMVGEISGVSPPRLKLPPHLARIVAKASAQVEALLPKRSASLLPDPVVFEMASKYWGLRSRYADKDLAYQCRDPKETLRDTVQWLRENHESLG